MCDANRLDASLPVRDGGCGQKCLSRGTRACELNDASNTATIRDRVTAFDFVHTTDTGITCTYVFFSRLRNHLLQAPNVCWRVERFV